MPYRVMPSYDSYEGARAEFEWDLPADYNPARDLLRKHENPDRVALRQAYPDGRRESYTFADLDELSGRLANALEDRGVEPGDRIGVMVPQTYQNPVSHLAAWKLGAVTVPLTVLFGPDALGYRLRDSEATALVADSSVRDTVADVREDCPELEVVFDVGADPPAESTSFDDAVAAASPERAIHDSTPETESALMYTSGSTGPPKGVLHSHALWLGRAAAANVFFDQELGPEATTWTPADWAWGAALGGLLFGTWHHGGTVVGYPGGSFDAEAAFSLLEEFDVTKAFVPPTALRMMMEVDDPTTRYDLSVTTVSTVGEPLTPEILEWTDAELGDVSINEFYGQTELNLVVSNCSKWFDTQVGSMGKAMPGYDVAVVDPDTGDHLDAGEVGEIAVRPHDRRVFFDEYWNRPEATQEKQLDEWFLTGDLATLDEEGYLSFKSRADDVIITSGYRVGPTEVEEAVLEHPQVQQAGVIGVPDDTRGEVIKAFVEPVSDPGEALRGEIRDLVRENLAQYEYPREIEFMDELPQTTSGKIRRIELREHEGLE